MAHLAQKTSDIQNHPADTGEEYRVAGAARNLISEVGMMRCIVTEKEPFCVQEHKRGDVRGGCSTSLRQRGMLASGLGGTNPFFI